MDKDIELLKNCIENRSPILLLGAGFSLGAKGQSGQELMLGGTLAEKLYEEIIIPNKDELTEEALDMARHAKKWKKLYIMSNVIRENNLIPQNNLQIEHEQSVIRSLSQKKCCSLYATVEYSIDELPLYE